jgi:hypothetical protein
MLRTFWVSIFPIRQENTKHGGQIVVRGRGMEQDHEIRGSAYQKGKSSMDVVCVDSSFIETKKGEKILHTAAIKRE